MKKTLLALATVCGLLFSANAQDNKLFADREVSLLLFSGYDLNQDYDLNGSLGFQMYPTRNFGASVTVPLYRTDGVIVDQASFALLARLPLGIVSPYVGAGARFNWEENRWNPVVHAGVEARISQHFGAFGQFSWQPTEFGNWGDAKSSVEVGLNLLVWRK